MHATGPAEAFGAGVGILFFFVWFAMMAGMVVGWILLLIAIWRGMKAHESIANSVAFIAQKMNRADEPAQPPA